MSHMEMATLEYANACNQILDGAQSEIQELMRRCEATKKNSSKLMTGVIEGMLEDISSTADDMLRSISDRRAAIGTATYSSAIDQTRQFVSSLNSINYKEMMLSQALSAAFDEKMAAGNKATYADQISGIRDEKLRSVVSLLSRNEKHSDLSFEELVELGESVLDPSKKVRRKLVSSTIDAAEHKMESAKVSSDALKEEFGTNAAISPLEVMDKAFSEIIDEKLRKSAIQAIVKSITARGFVVDRSNIRVQRETNTVTLKAVKPGGQTADFSIDLSGKFVYHFQGYEGRACEKDIGPLEKDLEEVYGIKLTDRKTLWSNPDKLNKSHHAEVKVRRNRCR